VEQLQNRIRDLEQQNSSFLSSLSPTFIPPCEKDNPSLSVYRALEQIQQSSTCVQVLSPQSSHHETYLPVLETISSEPRTLGNSGTTPDIQNPSLRETSHVPRFFARENARSSSLGMTNCSDDDDSPHLNPASNMEKGFEGVSAMVGAVTGEPQNEGFLGSSSAAAFMKHIRKAIDSRLGVSPLDEEFHGNDRFQTVTNTAHLQPVSEESKRKYLLDDYVLPPRKLADSLLNTYWTYVHPLYPFLNRGSFTRIYNDIWTGSNAATTASTSPQASSTTDESTSLCIFNLVLALSCQYSDEIEPRKCQATARVFFTRAKDLLRFDPVDSADRSVQLVQALLLMGQYLQGIGSTHKAWGIVGMAIRVCHELGLHLAVTTSERVVQNILEREMMRRVYHGCVMMERYVFEWSGCI
jgi:hypothetical protein